MRTQDEIVEHYRKIKDEDWLGFTAEALFVYLDAENLQKLAEKEADLSGWEPVPLTEKGVKSEMKEYMEFAWGKALNHRGISAGRSVEKLSTWLWLLGDDELHKFAEDNSNYENYGAPVLKVICEKYDFPMPDTEDALNMAQGKPCYAGCGEGCGK